MLRTGLLIVASLAGLAVTGAGGVLASLLLGSVSDSDKAIGVGIVVALLVWVALHGLGWFLSGREAHATAGLVVLGAVTLLDVGGVVLLLGAIEAGARP